MPDNYLEHGLDVGHISTYVSLQRASTALVIDTQRARPDRVSEPSESGFHFLQFEHLLVREVIGGQSARRSPVGGCPPLPTPLIKPCSWGWVNLLWALSWPFLTTLDPHPLGRARPQRAWAGFPPRSDSSAVPGFRARCPGSRSDRVAARPGRRARVPGTPLGCPAEEGTPPSPPAPQRSRTQPTSPHPLRGGPAGGSPSPRPAPGSPQRELLGGLPGSTMSLSGPGGSAGVDGGRGPFCGQAPPRPRTGRRRRARRAPAVR